MQIWDITRQTGEPENALPYSRRSMDLLTASPLIPLSDRNQMAEGLERAYRVLSADFEAQDLEMVGLANRVELGEVTLHYCRYETQTDIRFAHMDGFRQFFCLAGSGRISVAGRGIETAPRQTGIVPPDSDFKAVYAPGYAHLVLQFSERVLLRKFELLEGRSAPGALSLPLFETLDAAHVWRLRDTALCLAGQFDRLSPGNRMVVAELEQALVSTFLVENRSAFPGLLATSPRLAGQNDLKRLEEYIHAHWDQPLTIEAVAEACGVSVRSVYARFKDHHGVPPLSYMRDVRLVRAHEMLKDPHQRQSVLDIALKCGFHSFGHFARRYRERFGELPSATLSRAGQRRR